MKNKQVFSCCLQTQKMPKLIDFIVMGGGDERGVGDRRSTFLAAAAAAKVGTHLKL